MWRAIGVVRCVPGPQIRASSFHLRRAVDSRIVSKSATIARARRKRRRDGRRAIELGEAMGDRWREWYWISPFAGTRSLDRAVPRLQTLQLDETMARLQAQTQGAPLFRILGGMRYRKNRAEWIALLERMDQMIRPELLRESLAVQEWLEEGRAEGLERGVEKGLYDSLIAILSAKFPGLKSSLGFGSIRLQTRQCSSGLIRKIAVAQRCRCGSAHRSNESSKRASH